ncbi:MAG: hypothetical protein D6820_15535, partial [Lentisphaerae bacterium]
MGSQFPLNWPGKRIRCQWGQPWFQTTILLMALAPGMMVQSTLPAPGIDSELFAEIRADNARIELNPSGLAISIPSGRHARIRIPWKTDLSPWLFLTFRFDYQSEVETLFTIRLKGEIQPGLRQKGPWFFNQSYSG